MSRTWPAPRLRPFDLACYLGSEERGLPPPYTPAQLVVMGAGAIGLLAALTMPRAGPARRAARAASDHNRARFHRRPP